MIPRVIHCFWFGGKPFDSMSEKCIESWKKYCPDYQIRIWNESNYDITKNQYMKQAYDSGKYGFMVDYARLDVIYRYGGIYLDTDVELLKSLDELLDNKCFMGFETEKTVALGLGFGAEPKNDTIYSLLSYYEDVEFILPNGSLNLRPSPGIQTEVLKKIGMIPNGEEQTIGDGCHIYPKCVFNPCDIDTRIITIEEKTISIHHYAGSWLTKKNQRNTKLYSLIARFGGINIAKKIRRAYKGIKRKIKNIV